MRLPLEWLHDHVRPDEDVHALAARLDETGTKVERVLAHGVAALQFFVVGRVLSAVPHPDADRLSVCRVELGEPAEAQIVCGAPNVAAGQTVAVARPGAVMPDGTRLEKARLRGIESEGMILAEDELALGTDHAGILVLAEDGVAPGTPLAEVLPIATEVLELEITPNRPDCLGVYGVAREVHAATGAPLAPPPWASDPGSEGPVEGVEVTVEVPELCPRFTARRFDDVTIGPSPPWLKGRLMAAGQRPINNVVDITNYVMLLTGQPLHAFDLDRVAGGRLTVRRAADGEEMETLDGQRRRLDADMVLIADADGPTSIAGVMGGARSEVAPDTTRVLLEAATWDGPNINRTSSRLNLRSEASARFEKGLQPEQGMEAQAVATALLVEECGARLVGGTIDVGGPGPPPATIHLRDARIERLLGVRVERARTRDILDSLGFESAERDDGLDVSVPAWRRGDVTREADLIEEVARIDGVERLPATLPARRETRGRLTPTQRLRRRVADALTDRGLHEVAGWSFTSPSVAERLRLGADDPRRRFVALRNPMSEDESVLRTTVLGSLLDVARHNAARDAGALRLFELGPVYADDGAELPRERLHLGGLLAGPVRPPSWRDPAPPADFFAVKGIVEALLRTLRVPTAWAGASEPFLHPGRAARVGDLGWAGELHPLVAGTWDLEGVAAFELDLDALSAPAGEPYVGVPAFPAVRQDLAVVVADDVPAGRVLEVARGASGALESVEVFDVYRGAQVGEGRVSLALHLAFRATDRTLTEEEGSAERERIGAALDRELGAELRG